jgi:hypothetical protein
VGTALPDETTVAVGAAWPAGWVEMGKTLTPVAMAVTTETFKLEVEQSIVPVRVTRTKTGITIKTTLAEFTGANLARAVDGSLVTVAAGVGQKGFDTVEVDASKSDVSLYAVGIEGVKVLDNGSRQPVRFFALRASITMGGDVTLSKAAATGIPIEIEALADASGDALVVHIVNAPAS